MDEMMLIFFKVVDAHASDRAGQHHFIKPEKQNGFS